MKISNKNENESKGKNNYTELESVPKILPLPNGPLYLLNDLKPVIVENLRNSRGETLYNVRGIALCRCGASKNKPFCDGSHSLMKFVTENTSESNGLTRKGKSKKSYVGSAITIHDNRSLCSHAAHCVENLSSVFRQSSRPWINPDSATKEKIIETIRQCPSGALSYSLDDVEFKDVADRKPLITVSKNGPYLISGGIELLGETKIDDDASKEHYTLCRCGASRNKPFCDGSHNSINFSDEIN